MNPTAKQTMVLETCHDEGHRHTDTYWLSIQHSQLKNVTIEDCEWRSHGNCVFNCKAKVLQTLMLMTITQAAPLIFMFNIHFSLVTFVFIKQARIDINQL